MKHMKPEISFWTVYFVINAAVLLGALIAHIATNHPTVLNIEGKNRFIEKPGLVPKIVNGKDQWVETDTTNCDEVH